MSLREHRYWMEALIRFIVDGREISSLEEFVFYCGWRDDLGIHWWKRHEKPTERE